MNTIQESNKLLSKGCYNYRDGPDRRPVSSQRPPYPDDPYYVHNHRSERHADQSPIMDDGQKSCRPTEKLRVRAPACRPRRQSHNGLDRTRSDSHSERVGRSLVGNYTNYGDDWNGLVGLRRFLIEEHMRCIPTQNRLLHVVQFIISSGHRPNHNEEHVQHYRYLNQSLGGLSDSPSDCKPAIRTTLRSSDEANSIQRHDCQSPKRVFKIKSRPTFSSYVQKVCEHRDKRDRRTNDVSLRSWNKRTFHFLRYCKEARRRSPARVGYPRFRPSCYNNQAGLQRQSSNRRPPCRRWNRLAEINVLKRIILLLLLIGCRCHVTLCNSK